MLSASEHPLTLSNPDFKEFWDLTLEECVSITLANSKILRGGTAARLQNGQILPGVQRRLASLTQLGGVFASTYDPAIVESNPGFSQFSLFGQPAPTAPVSMAAIATCGKASKRLSRNSTPRSASSAILARRSPAAPTGRKT